MKDKVCCKVCDKYMTIRRIESILVRKSQNNCKKEKENEKEREREREKHKK